MRCIIECVIANENGNRSILDGTLPAKVQKYLEAVKPEAVYFTIKNGQRTMIAVVNIASEDKMVATNEPLWLDWNASVSCITRDDACRSAEGRKGHGEHCKGKEAVKTG